MSVRPPLAVGSTRSNASSVPAQRVRASTTSNIALFLSNIRLLDLHKLSDWPDVTCSTFDTKDAAQNQKRRVSSVEWLLFRLFQILDPAMTKEKLQPFFPPLEPLQSINLRAALFRCLNDLKKNGLLGREAILRKTMLDECKGEKFEELLVIFSALVLRRKVLARPHNHAMPISQKLGMMDSMSNEDSKNLFPLTLVHRASLTELLHRRAESRALFESLRNAIHQKQQQSQQRYESVDAAQHGLNESLNPELAKAVRLEVHRNWAGATEGSQLLLNGQMAMSDDTDIKSSYIDALETFQQTGNLPTAAKEAPLLERLEASLIEQDQRLERLNEHNARMTQTEQSDHRNNAHLDRAVKNVLGDGLFDGHQNIRLESTYEEIPPSIGDKSVAKYNVTISALEREISEIVDQGRRDRKSSNGKLPSLWSSPKSGVRRSQTLTKRMSSGSHYHGQVPDLRAETHRTEFDLFSPLKSVDPVVDVGSDHPAPANLESLTSGSHKYYDSTTEIQKLPHNASSQRTRASTALSSSKVPEIATSQMAGIRRTNTLQDTTSGTDRPASTRRISLADRTRESINFATLMPQTKFKQRQAQREIPDTFPINQFETPIKSKSAYTALGEETRQNMGSGIDTTPKDNLFSEDAEYASVFKSRPKIALSPVLSPDVNNISQLDYSSIEDMPELGSSPLRGR